MKPIFTFAAILAATAAQAGGPVLITEDPAPVVQDRPASSVGVLPLLLIILCVALCGGDGDGKPDPGCKTGGGCE